MNAKELREAAEKSRAWYTTPNLPDACNRVPDHVFYTGYHLAQHVLATVRDDDDEPASEAPKIVTNHQITGPELLAMAHGGSVSLDDETILTLHPDAYVNAAFLGQPVLDPRAVQDARLAQARSMISLFLQDEIGRDTLSDEFGKVFPQS